MLAAAIEFHFGWVITDTAGSADPSACQVDAQKTTPTARVEVPPPIFEEP